jgi:protein-S-isoprenylcysteine O-methyltransferase Ste14
MSSKSLARAIHPEAIEVRGENSASPGFVVPGPAGSWWATPWMDKTLAVLAVLPFVYPIAKHFRQHLNLVEATYLVQTLVLIGTMLSRRMPVRITTNPYYWAVAFIGSYWGLFLLSVKEPGRALVGPWTVILLYSLSVFTDIWGRLSLGRNIGMLPAQREIVERGAYGWVRHPIYTSVLIMVLIGFLTAYSFRNLALYSLGVFWFVARTLAEEEFLQKDPAYAAYMKRVRWRWFPGLL